MDGPRKHSCAQEMAFFYAASSDAGSRALSCLSCLIEGGTTADDGAAAVDGLMDPGPGARVKNGSEHRALMPRQAPV
jgi:hypothetical protein